MLLDPQAEELLKKLADSGTQSRRRLHLCIRLVKGALPENGVKRLNSRDIDCRTCQGKIVARLHIHPVKRCCLECLRQSKCSIRCYRRLALYDALYARAGHAQFLCQGPALISRGLRYSSSRTSPGCSGARISAISSSPQW